MFGSSKSGYRSFLGPESGGHRRSESTSAGLEGHAFTTSYGVNGALVVGFLGDHGFRFPQRRNARGQARLWRNAGDLFAMQGSDRLQCDALVELQIASESGLLLGDAVAVGERCLDGTRTAAVELHVTTATANRDQLSFVQADVHLYRHRRCARQSQTRHAYEGNQGLFHGCLLLAVARTSMRPTNVNSPYTLRGQAGEFLLPMQFGTRVIVIIQIRESLSNNFYPPLEFLEIESKNFY
jgi:hypothetical protein